MILGVFGHPLRATRGDVGVDRRPPKNIRTEGRICAVGVSVREFIRYA